MTSDFPHHTGRRKTRVHLTQAEIQRRQREGSKALHETLAKAQAPLYMDTDSPKQMEMFPTTPQILCEHYECRCARAEELAQMGMVESAIRVHNQKVRCRHVK